MILARPSSFAVGEMRDRITIYTPTVAINDIGEPVRTWAVYLLNQPAKWITTAGGEVIRGRSFEADIAAVFQIHFQTGITPQMRVVHTSGTYGIGYVKQIDGRRRYIELQCRQAVT